MAEKKQDELHDLCLHRLSLAKKFADEYQKNVKKWLDDYNIESLDIEDEDLHTVLQIPYIFATIESQLPTIFENTPSLIIKKRGKKDKDFTDFTNNVWDYVQEIISMKEKIENAGFNFLALGQSSARWGWKLETEKVEQEELMPLGEGIEPEPVKKVIEVPVVNEPYLKIHQHNRIYFSPESYFTVFDSENSIPYIITEELMTADAIKERFDVEVDESTFMDVSDFSDEFDKMSDEQKEDLKRIHVYEYHGTLPQKESGDPKWKSYKVYRYAFTKTEKLEAPVQVKNKPTALLGNYGSYNKFFRFGEPKVMRELEQDISLGRSTIADYRDKLATKIALDMTTEVDEANLRSPKKLALVRFSGNRPPEYMSPPPIPDAVIEALNMSKADAQMVSAQLDISRGSTQSVVDTATGQKIFESANERRINRKRKKIGEFIKIIAVNILKLCAENWDIEMFAKITDLDPMEIQQKQLIEKLAEIDTFFNVEIDVEDVITNKAEKSAQAIALYRETKEDPLVNRREILRNALEVGFGEKDFERYLNDFVTPEEAVRVVTYLVQLQMIPQQIGMQMIEYLMAQSQGGSVGGGKEGRPAVADPTSIVQKAMPGSDSNQMTAQASAAYKQQNVPKGQQGV